MTDWMQQLSAFLQRAAGHELGAHVCGKSLQSRYYCTKCKHDHLVQYKQFSGMSVATLMPSKIFMAHMNCARRSGRGALHPITEKWFRENADQIEWKRKRTR